MDFVILGLSGKALAGKTTAHDAARLIMKNHPGLQGYTTVYMPLAEALKDLCTELHGWDGDKTIYYLPDGSVDKTRGRQLLIEVGAFHRSINPTVWVDYVSKKITEYIKSAHTNQIVFIIDDIRYKNEMSVLSKFGKKFLSVRLSRKSQLNLDTQSEKDLDDFHDFDYHLDNNGTIEDLEGLMKQIMEDLLTRSKGRVHV